MTIGYQARLHRRGVGRYVNAAFLGLWLCGWLIGVCFAVFVLIWASHSLLTGDASDGQPIGLPAAVGMGVFLLVWLSFWTIGGIAAITELLRELWGEDRVAVAPDALVAEWRAGPFRRSRSIPRSEILDLVRLPQKGVLAVETARERIEICRLGSDAERRAVADALRRELGLTGSAKATPPVLPEDWAELVTPEGAVALVPDPATRRIQTRIAAFFSLAALGMTAVFARGALDDRSWLQPALISGAFAAALAAGTAWLASARREWRIEPGRLVLQRRFGARVTERFHATRLALTMHEDSDMDEWFTLEARGETGTDAMKKIASHMNDDSIPRRLGAWLAQRTGIPLDDRTTREVRDAEIAALRARLEASGRLGRMLSRWIDRMSRPGDH